MTSSREIPLSADSSAIATWVWRNLVPKAGQCDTVQGELLRAVEKLRWEAQNNGNANWDDGFERLAAFLETTLCSEPRLDENAKAAVQDDLRIVRDFEQPHVEDDVYDRLTEHVVAFCRIHPRAIDRAADPGLHR
jgi:hypothetical protein